MSKLKKDIDATIRFLYFLANNQGMAGIDLFSDWTARIQINLERDGLLAHAETTSREELIAALLKFANPHDYEDIEASYKRTVNDIDFLT